MANQCFMAEDQGHFSARALITISPEVQGDSLAAADAVYTGRSLTLIEHAVAGEAAGLNPAFLVAESLRVRDSAAIVQSTGVTAADAVRVGDGAYVTFHELPNEALRIADVAFARWSFKETDHATFIERYTPLRHASALPADRLRVAAGATWRVQMISADVLHAGDAWSVRRTGVITDAAVISDAVDAQGAVSDVVGDSLSVRAVAAGVVAARAMVLETISVEALDLLPATGQAWTANTDTWAASRYEGFRLNSLVAIDGALYGAGPEGLYAVDGADDAGAPIAASVLSDQRPGGPEASLRRGGYVYAVMSADGDMGARVFDNAAGHRHAYTYTFEARRNSELAPMRVKYGRGVKSLMWQFEIFNQQGADFRISGGLAWVIDPGSRRV